MSLAKVRDVIISPHCIVSPFPCLIPSLLPTPRLPHPIPLLLSPISFFLLSCLIFFLSFLPDLIFSLLFSSSPTSSPYPISSTLSSLYLPPIRLSHLFPLLPYLTMSLSSSLLPYLVFSFFPYQVSLLSCLSSPPPLLLHLLPLLLSSHHSLPSPLSPRCPCKTNRSL